MSSRRKGNRNELKAVKELEEGGWLVYRVKGSTRWNRNVDMFGLFDLCAKRGKNTRWLQIKTNRKPAFGPYKDFKANHCSEYETVEVWVYIDYKSSKRWLI